METTINDMELNGMITIKQEIRKEIERHLANECSKIYFKELCEQWQRIGEILDACNFPQSWALYKLSLQGTIFLPLYCTDYLGINMGSMFCGIERDGYMHS